MSAPPGPDNDTNIRMTATSRIQPSNISGDDRDRTSVAIASRRSDLVTAVTTQLASDVRFRIVGKPVKTPARLLKLLGEHRPRLLLLDRVLFERLSTEDFTRIKEILPRLRVLLLCDRVHSSFVHEIAHDRLHGVLLTSLPPGRFAEAFAKVSRGELWVSRAMLERVVSDYARRADPSLLGPGLRTLLTPRERETVECLCHGLTNRQIADTLGVCEDTVKKHLHNIYSKLGIRNRSQLIAKQSLL